MGSASVTSPIAKVKKEKLEDVVGKNKWRVNNLLDNEYNPRSTEDIIEDAKAMEGKTEQYKITSANCEHFATNLRYGKAESRQVCQAEALGFGTVIFCVAAAAAVLSGGGKKEKESKH